MAPVEERRHDVLRSGLLSRVDDAGPRILALIAPAGYGKSTFARQCAGELTAICDCSPSHSLIDLAREILVALSSVAPPLDAAFYAQCQLETGLGATAASDAAVRAWRRQSESGTFVFENAESLARIDGGVSLLARLLTALPPARFVIICSRELLPLRLSRFVKPYETLSFGAEDLRLGTSEFAQMFQPPLPQDIATRAFALSGGWPMVAALFARFWQQGQLDRLLSRLDDVAFDELHRYAIEEALGTLSSLLVDALTTAALIPEATMQDVTRACGAEACGELAQYAHGSPFVRIDGDRIELHPLISAALIKRCEGQRDTMVRSLAKQFESSQQYIRAAELYIAARDQDAAARNIEAVSWLDAPVPAVNIARIVAKLDRDVITRYPQLWGVAIAFSRFSIDPVVAVDEARVLLQRLADVPGDRRMHVIRPLAGYLSRLGMHQEGYRLICDLEREIGVPEMPRSINEAAVLYIRMMIAARLGKTNEAFSLADRVRSFALRHDGMASLYLVEFAAETLRVLGRHDEERRALEQALERSQHGGYTVNAGLALAEISFGAWLRGDDETFDRAVRELEPCVENEGVHGLWYYAKVARGNRDLPPLGLELPKWIACAHLVAACNRNEIGEAARHAAAAREAAEKYGSPFTKVLAAIVQAEITPQTRSEWLTAAFETAQQIESEPLQRAIQARIAGDADTGMLTPLFSRLQSDLRDRPVPCDVSLLRGEATVNGRHVPLSDRKLEVVAALAQSPNGCGREAILEKVWPEHEETSAINAFNICLHQLRKLLGEQSIVLKRDRYLFGDNVRVDIREIEEYSNAIALRKQLSESQNALLRRFYERLCEPLPECYASWEWFQPTERRIAELRCEVAGRLAREALAHGDAEQALALARKIMEYDSCDEPAREIAIRAYVAVGDEAAAFREYRRYREILLAELQAVPSLSIDTILREAR